MKVLPFTRDAYNLLHQGSLALARIEAAGMRVDVDYLNRAIRRTERRIKKMESRLQDTDIAKEWRRAYGSRMNLNSNEQLGDVLFHRLGFPSSGRTASGIHRTDAEALEAVDDPFVRDYLQLAGLKKALATNLKGLSREVVDGFVHPVFHLHMARTYRSSSEAINFQNQPVRNPEIMKLIRTAFIPRKGRQIVEVDISGAEVRIAACYHRDPRMIDYILDPSKDMHRDMAGECFLLPPEQIDKTARYCGKNMFVFPQFYGDWYIDCARSLWAAIDKFKLTTGTGVPMKEHLKAKGIRGLGALDPKKDPKPGTFEHHIQKVQEAFWGERFRVYSAWKQTWYETYLKKGYFKTLTGFVCQGYMRRNEVINYPVQGSAFHCLLWALIQMVLIHLPRRKMKSVVVGQIHDSIVSDCPPEEVDDFVGLCHHLIVDVLPSRWPWLAVPLAIEAEASEVDGNWAEKRKVEVPE